MRTWKFAVALCIVASGAGAIAAGTPEEPGIAVDFASLQQADEVARLIEPVGLVRGDDGATRRFYLAPIIGSSWGQLLTPEQSFGNNGLFTAGGAAGVAVTRPLGQVRFDVEGRYRDAINGTAGIVNIAATDNWSTLANIWRDFGITDTLGVYGGGGIGAGGYRFLYNAEGNNFANSQNTAFAWQIGGGVIYAVSDRVTLDLGYRYYSVDPFSACQCGGVGEIRNQFVSNELLLAVRIYEPFRRWR